MLYVCMVLCLYVVWVVFVLCLKEIMIVKARVTDDKIYNLLYVEGKSLRLNYTVSG